MLLCPHWAWEVGSSPLVDTEEDVDAFLSLNCVRHNSKDLGNEGNELEYHSKKRMKEGKVCSVNKVTWKPFVLSFYFLQSEIVFNVFNQNSHENQDCEVTSPH